MDDLCPVKQEQNYMTIQDINMPRDNLESVLQAQLIKYFKVYRGRLPSPGLYGRKLKVIERPLIKLSLSATFGNQVKAAKMLGLNRNTLRKKIHDLGIQVIRTTD